MSVQPPEKSASAPSSGLDILITEVALDLMGVPRSKADEATDRVLDRLVDFFCVDDTFIRRHRSDRVSELVTIRPDRDRGDAAHLIQEIPFDSDPVFQMSEHLKEPLVLYPEGSDAIQDLVKESIGVERCSFATVPLLSEERTVGILALVRFTDQEWTDDEVRTLFAIATLIAQFWSRLDAEERLVHQAHHDEMTGLPNRLKLNELISEAKARQECELVSLLSINIDNMKAINDALDFGKGDKFLAEFARRLEETVRRDSVVARLAGDHFGVLVRNVPPTEVEALARRLLEELKSPIDLGDITISRSVSIGVAHTPHDAIEHDLISEAEAALHLAKKDGKGQIRVYDNVMRMEVTNRFEQELELRRALEAEEFILHYQPAFDLQTGEVVGVEALLRWNHPSGELRSAGSFIQTAEETGLVVDIGDYVLAKAIDQLSTWQGRFPRLEMWINVSPAQIISRDLAVQVSALIDRYGVDPARVCLEVTEHVVLDDVDAATTALNHLRAMGVKLAIDDFGTGYSSMQQLKNLPVDALKIDMSFVAGLGVSDHDGAIVDAAITLARAFGLETVAEGVETVEQLNELIKRGCDHAQGYLLAKPKSPAELEDLIDRRAPEVVKSRRAGISS